MQNSTDCLNAAMFIAAENYSGSTYGVNLFRAMDEICDDALTVAPGLGPSSLPVLAAWHPSLTQQENDHDQGTRKKSCRHHRRQ
jgi:hypothetical protein